MKLITCPEIFKNKEKSLFIAGGISNCPNWQEKLISLLKNENVTIINPRRKNFNVFNKEMEEEQIKWEFENLDSSTAVSFWFPKETLCPITLYELGKMCMTNKKLFIGIHEGYSRKRDVEMQTKLIRPEIKIKYSIEDLSEEIKKWSKNEIKI